MSTVTIIGGHGKVALLAAPLLVEAGHRVRSVIRNPDHREEVAATGAEPVVADVENLDVPGLVEVLSGSDVVVFSAGAGGGSPARTRAVDHDAAVRSMQAAGEAGISRYVMVSYYGAGTDNVPEDDPFYPYAKAKADADAALRGTDLEWTVLGPSRLTSEDPTGLIDVDRGSGEVSRGNVALVIAATVEDPSTIRRTINFDDGSTPVAEAIRAS